MRKSPLAMGACMALMFSVWTCGVVMAADQASTKPITSGSVKPHLGNGPADEKSMPSSASAAKTTGTTGATNQSQAVKSMNTSEKNKVEATGK